MSKPPRKTELQLRLEQHSGKTPEQRERERASEFAAAVITQNIRVLADQAAAAKPGPRDEDTAAPAAAPATTTEAGEGRAPLGNTGDSSVQTVRMYASATGELLEFPVRRGHGGSAAFVDWVNLTIHRDTALRYCEFATSYDDFVLAISLRLESIFGFGVTAKRNGGLHFFKQAYDLGDKWGVVCIGGQRSRIMISLSGEGCAAARPGWEARLVEWLRTEVEEPKLTRVDLAYDDFEGDDYSVDRGLADFHDGQFTNPRAPRAPEVQCLGNWINPSGKGRTLTIGMRTSDQFLRVYERGKKEGCVESEWVRIEGEYKAKQSVLPYDMLLQPGAYLAAMYPALGWISEEQHRIKAVEKAAQINVEAAQEWFQTQCGHYLKTFIDLFGQEEALQRLQRDAFPRRLKVPDHTLSPDPLRLDNRLDGITSHELSVFADMHMQGLHVPVSFFGPRSYLPEMQGETESTASATGQLRPDAYSRLRG